MQACRKAVALAATTAMLVASAGCSDSAPSAGQFVSKIDGICRRLNTDLGDLSKPTAQDEVKSFALDASDLFAGAVKDLKALEVPAASGQVSDAKDLVSKLDHLVDVLDDIATAAKAGDDSTVSSKADEFESVRGDIADLADNLDARHCDLDAQFDELAPPVTEPATTTPNTSTPTGGGTKTPAAIAAKMVPTGGFSFTDVQADLVTTWGSLVNASPTAAPAGGVIGAVDVSLNGSVIGRLFFFLPDAPLADTVVTELATSLIDGAAPTGETVSGFPGVSWTNADNVVAFVGAEQAGTSGLFVYAASPSHDGMAAVVTGFLASLPTN